MLLLLLTTLTALALADYAPHVQLDCPDVKCPDITCPACKCSGSCSKSGVSKPLELRVMNWNVWRGQEANTIVSNVSSPGGGPVDELVDGGVNVPLPAFRDFRNDAIFADLFGQPARRPNDRDSQQAMENTWLQIVHPNLGATVERYRQIAGVIAEELPDVINLQMCTRVVSNNVTQLPRFSTLEFNDAFIGNADSPDAWKVIDCAQIIIDRVFSLTSKRYRVAARDMMGSSSGGLRSLSRDVKGDLSFSEELTIATLVASDIGILDTDKYLSVRSPKTKSLNIWADDGTEENQTFLKDVSFEGAIKRGYIISDLTKNGAQFRVINCHFPSGSAGQFGQGSPLREFLSLDGRESRFANRASTRAAIADEILSQAVENSDYPVIFAGDFAIEPLSLQLTFGGISSQVPPTPLLSLSGALTDDGQLSETGGVFLNSLFEIHPEYAATFDELVKHTNAMPINPAPLTKPQILRAPDSEFLFLNDFVLVRDGDGADIHNHRTLPAAPLPQSQDAPFAWPSDHRAVVIDVTLPKQICGQLQRFPKTGVVEATIGFDIQSTDPLMPLRATAVQKSTELNAVDW